jgi:ABC-type multidrug transport system fused ATPase/permease subunit
MSEEQRERPGFIEVSYPGEPEQPNAPEVSGTSFPLLSTVLAGFAITTGVQLVLGTDIAETMTGKIVVALVLVMLSALLFLSSTGFALNAQANNYLPFLELGESGRKLLHIDDHAAWVTRVSRRWKRFYTTAVLFFSLGVLLLLAGVNLIVWEFAGSTLAIALLIAILANVALVVGVTIVLNRDPERAAIRDRDAARSPLSNDVDDQATHDG